MSPRPNRARDPRVKRKIAACAAAVLAAVALALSPASALAAPKFGAATCNADLVMHADGYGGYEPTHEWAVFYTTVARFNGSTYVPDGSRWQGPIYLHTDYPGWYWTASAGWRHASWDPRGGQTHFPLARGTGMYRGYQWIKYLTTNRVYQGLMDLWGCNTNT